jgi:uncharacterized damage-inducible protein DinB
MIRSRFLMVLASLTLPVAASAQAPAVIEKEFLLQFEQSMDKFLQLAEAMPADRFTWSPGEGVMEVGHVYMHVAHYNYNYPITSLGMTKPAGLDLDKMESVRDKAAVIKALRESRDFVRAAAQRIEGEQWAKITRLYGRDVPQWSVMLQLVAHMNEHLGQSIAYARMNKIVPPWSR